MNFSDLHIHSRYSDGMLWPEEIIKIAHNKGINCLSITDHDTIDSQLHIKELSERFNINVVPGIELSTEYREKEIHILGYFIDINNGLLISKLNEIKESRKNRANNIVTKLNALNINISLEEVINENISIGRPHIAKVLVKKGYVNTMKEAFRQYLTKGSPGYVDRYKVNYKDALKLINDSNGIPVLAHPGEIYKGISIEEVIKEFKVYGLRGIEVFHPCHTTKQNISYYNLAKKYSLLITGGSDYHGLSYGDEPLIGTHGLDKNLTEKFLKSHLK